MKVKECKDMYGCRYCKMNEKNEEYCTLTKELTKGAVMCDFEYEDCPEYQKALQPIKVKPRERKPKTATQTSIFGAAGEKQINV